MSSSVDCEVAVIMMCGFRCVCLDVVRLEQHPYIGLAPDQPNSFCFADAWPQILLFLFVDMCHKYHTVEFVLTKVVGKKCIDLMNN